VKKFFEKYVFIIFFLFVSKPMFAQPVISVSPASIDFGDVEVGSLIKQEIIIKNVGTANLNILGMNTSAYLNFIIDNRYIGILPPDSSVIITVSFVPTAVKYYTEYLFISHNAAGTPATIHMQGRGMVHDQPFMSISKTSINFRDVGVGSFACDTIIVRNNGDADLNISSIYINSTAFQLGSFPSTLAPGSSTAFTVCFVPTMFTNYTGNITISHNAYGSPTTILLTGRGVSLNWVFSKVIYSGSTHGVTVDPDDNVWINLVGANPDFHPALDVSGSILVLNPDGTTKSAISRSYFLGTAGGAGSGINVGPDGTVYSSHGNAVVKWNYKTIQPLGFMIPDPNQSLYVTTAAADEHGNIAVGNFSVSGSVNFSGHTSISVFSGTVHSVILGELRYIARDITMSRDGKDIYISSDGSMGISAPVGVNHLHSEDGTTGTYKLSSTPIVYSVPTENVHLDAQGNLWVSVDPFREDYDYSAKYDCWDLNTMQVINSLSSTAYVPYDSKDQYLFSQGAFGKPRGIAFSNDGTKAYICDMNNGVLQYKFNGLINTPEPQAMPENFMLSQNYPNPFNPSTNFNYSLPSTSDVKIVIHDLFGREVTTLVNEIGKAAGTYNVTWNGKDRYNRQVSSGIYFYNIQAGSFYKTMKMMLIK
jgi:sugar lactone lactonase YvrE